jgi:hypothetical protein
LSVATSNEAKIREDGANHHDELNNKSKSLLHPIIGRFQERELAKVRLWKRIAELGKRTVELSQLERESQAIAGQVMTLKQHLAEQTMTLQHQQNATAASSQREPPTRRRSRNLSDNILNLSARNLLKSPLGKYNNAMFLPLRVVQQCLLLACKNFSYELFAYCLLVCCRE